MDKLETPALGHERQGLDDDFCESNPSTITPENLIHINCLPTLQEIAVKRGDECSKSGALRTYLPNGIALVGVKNNLHKTPVPAYLYGGVR